MRTMPYERFEAWKLCHELALAVYEATKSYPTEERYGLVSQTRRAAFSAPVNIAEGSARRGPREFARFLDFSHSSLIELGYALRFARDCGILNRDTWKQLDELHARANYLTLRLNQAMRAAGNKAKGNG